MYLSTKNRTRKLEEYQTLSIMHMKRGIPKSRQAVQTPSCILNLLVVLTMAKKRRAEYFPCCLLHSTRFTRRRWEVGTTRVGGFDGVIWDFSRRDTTEIPAPSNLSLLHSSVSAAALFCMSHDETHFWALRGRRCASISTSGTCRSKPEASLQVLSIL